VIEAGAAGLPAAMREAIVAHARAALPHEACGLIAGDRPAAEGGRPSRWIPTRNAHASPYRFEIHPDDLLRATLEIDDAGGVVWAIVHSHVTSAARPSPSDIREARHPAALYLICSLDPGEADPVSGAPSLRAWRIRGGAGEEVPLSGG
jgi:[CysO sulfur-carrier protein]-S-L-cysteine hydrolase